MSPDYSLVKTAPPVADYLRLRLESGLSPKTEEQARAALPGSWAACHVLHAPTAAVVGMGRLLGDGDWYFHVVGVRSFPGTSAGAWAMP